MLQFEISASNKSPLYQQIIDQAVEAILCGKWPPGEALPSIRALAVQMGLSVITVKRAYQELERQNLIRTYPGKGSFVSGEIDLARESQLQALKAKMVDLMQLADLLGVSDEKLATLFYRVKQERTSS